MKGDRIKGGALSEVDTKVLEGQNSGDEQAPETVVNSPDGPPSTVVDEDGGEEFETWTEAERDLATVADEDEDEFDVAPEAGEGAQPFRWQSDVLCVADPFIETKVKFCSEKTGAAFYVMFLMTEPCWTHQTKRYHTLSGRLPACGDATAHGRKSRFPPVV